MNESSSLRRAIVLVGKIEYHVWKSPFEFSDSCFVLSNPAVVPECFSNGAWELQAIRQIFEIVACQLDCRQSSHIGNERRQFLKLVPLKSEFLKLR